MLGRYASNPELSFTWYDAAVLSQKIRQESRKATSAAPLRPAAAQRRGRAVVTAPRNLASHSRVMKSSANRFLQYLRVERNASALTIKSYREDLAALAEYLTEAYGGTRSAARTSTRCDLRGYVAALHEAGYAKTTIARRLASLRSFFRFGQREGWTKTNPAKPLRNPRKPARCRTFSRPRTSAGCSMLAAGRRAAGPARSGDSGNAVLGRPARERAGWAERGDLDFAGGTLRVRGKGRRERLAPVGSFAAAALEHWLAVRRVSAARACRRRGAGVRQQVRPPADHAQRRPDAGKVSRGPRASTAAPRRTRCGTASPRICSTAAPTSAACRNCWGTRAW